METERLNWKNLRRNKCPKCSGDLAQEFTTGMFKCTGSVCDFKITEERFLDVVTKMNKEALARSDYQQSEEVHDLDRAQPCNFCHGLHSMRERCPGFTI